MLYASFLVYWYHTSKIGNHVNWLFWVIVTLILIILPLALVLNQRMEDNKSANSIRSLSIIRRLIGSILLILPFVFMTLGDTAQKIQNYYTVHIHAIGANRAPVDTLIITVNGGSFLLGTFLIFLGRGSFFSSKSFLRLLLALIISVALVVALFFYGFARYYQF